MNHPLSRRKALATIPALAAMLSLAGPHTAQAQEAWPTKPFRWVVPYPPGGTSDILARAVGQRLSERLGQPVLIENRPGAGGNIGTDYVAKSNPDGYTWVLGNIGPMSVNISLYKSLPYDPQKDLEPISLLLTYPNIILVAENSPFKTLQDLLAQAKTTPLSYAGNGVGTSLHLTGELLARSAGVKLTHVPYKGDAPGLADLMGGVVPFNISPIASPMSLLKAGRIRALAVTGAQRHPLLPDVPTVAEAGVPGFDVTGWVGLLVAKGTPAPIVNRLVQEFEAVMQTPEIKKLIADDMLSTVPPMGPDYFAKFIRTETAKWRDVIQAANIKVE